MTTVKKRLAIVSTVAAPYRVSQHLRIVRELGDEVELWSLVLFEHDWQPWDYELPPEIRPIVFGKGQYGSEKNRYPFREWRKIGRVIRCLQENNIDMVITTGVSNPASLRLIRWCHRHNIPNFLFADANALGDKAGGIRRLIKNRYMKWVMKWITGLMPCGTRGKQYFERYGGNNKPCFFMPHEPDYGRIFQVSPEVRQATQVKFGLRPDRKRIVFSGRLAAVKGIDTLIDAFVEIAAKRPDWDLLIIGGGQLEQQLRERVPEALADRVVWAGFVNDRDELSALYTCAHVFVLPSRFEPWAVVVCEAAAAGLAMITSNMVGAGAELCREGVNGGIFPAGDVARLVELLLQITEDPARLQEMRTATLRVLDAWRRRGDPVQGVRLAMAHVGLLDPPPPVEPDPPTPVQLSETTAPISPLNQTQS